MTNPIHKWKCRECFYECQVQMYTKIPGAICPEGCTLSTQTAANWELVQ